MGETCKPLGYPHTGRAPLDTRYYVPRETVCEVHGLLAHSTFDHFHRNNFKLDEKVKRNWMKEMSLFIIFLVVGSEALTLLSQLNDLYFLG